MLPVEGGEAQSIAATLCLMHYLAPPTCRFDKNNVRHSTAISRHIRYDAAMLPLIFAIALTPLPPIAASAFMLRERRLSPYNTAHARLRSAHAAMALRLL